MRPDEYVTYDATGLAELVARGDVDAAEVLEAAVAVIDERNPEVNAFVARCDEDARAAVAAGLPDGPLRGVPYAIKDLNAQVAGLPGTNGCRLFTDVIAPVDSEFVARLRRAGMVIIGKTNTPAFGFSPSTEPVLFGPTRNPWDLTRSAGGSSGGAAAAVAAGMLPAAHATDGGGSIRIPASACGLFGLKTTRHRVTPAPYAGEIWAGLSVSHAVTRSVRDSALLLDLTCAPFPGDPARAPAPPRPYAEEIVTEPGRLRIGLLDTPVTPGITVDPEILEVLEAAARLCERLGHDVVPTTWPALPAAPAAPVSVISSANVAAAVDDRLSELGRSQHDDDLDVWLRDVVARARTTSAPDYARAVVTMHAIGRTIGTWMTDFDVLITPTLAMLPPPLGVLDPMRPITEAGGVLGALAGFTSVFNATGQPAMSIPLGSSSGGLPIGVQFVGHFGDESTLFRLAGQLEQTQPWTGLAPYGR
jgi:Asp-tRNA(Asn)/Glu-tRNA(Gln) amidotransferase A subunit family amidase